MKQPKSDHDIACENDSEDVHAFARQNPVEHSNAKFRPKGNQRPFEGTTRLALTTSEACSALAISPRSLKRLEERGLLKSSKALRIKMWPVAELIRFLEVTAS